MEERTITDFQNISSKLAGKIFYERDPRNEDFYRTIRMHLNVFANRVVPQYSNWVYGTPPEGVQPLPPLLLNALMRFQNSDTMFF
jgi:hypothetical protein